MKTKTPICDFAKQYAERKYARFHMPGHKGRALLGSEPYDITEITGADSLYEARGIIAESERNAAALYGTGATFYSAEGSSQCIRAMLYLSSLVAANKGCKPLIAATRNAHKVFALTAALLDMDVIWLNGDVRASLCECSLSPERLDEALAELKRLPDAVFITSPDYLGNIADVKGLAETAHRYGCLLICDVLEIFRRQMPPDGRRGGYVLRFGAQNAALLDRRSISAHRQKRAATFEG